jgi:hypothetical protein
MCSIVYYSLLQNSILSTVVFYNKLHYFSCGHTHFTVVLTLGMTQMKRMSRLRRSTEPAGTAETRTRYQDIPSPEDASFTVNTSQNLFFNLYLTRQVN